MNFYGPSCFSTVKDNFDLGQGDTFYNHPAAYQMPWGEALRYVSQKLVITQGSKGSDKIIEYSIDTFLEGQWVQGERHFTTQKAFWSENVVSLIP